MFSKLKISNFKSITDLEIELGRFNVFIGENGCGKTNILEAVALLGAAKSNQLEAANLSNRGIRVTKPNLTSSSFSGINLKKTIEITLDKAQCFLSNPDPSNIYSKWYDLVEVERESVIKDFAKNIDLAKLQEDAMKMALSLADSDMVVKKEISKIINKKFIDQTIKRYVQESIDIGLNNYLVYSLNSNSLRGLTSLNDSLPLGIFGEGLDVLINNFSIKEKQKLHELLQVVTWFSQLIIDNDKTLKNEGHNLGRSASSIYFTDKFMKRNNKIFAAENANEGVLFLLFYFTLFISDKTPKFFAVDNIETALNPKLCRDLIKQLTILSKENDKQVLITTHNPAVLDGLNLNDDEQRLFVVKRSDEGYTKVERIKLKPKTKATEGLKLSELWMRGYLGGLSQTSF
ncbi:MAG: AAA family ATPase [Bacteroidia bacterium]|nr:AAA family ATPase [Bacteroidia bacterium]